MNARDRLDLRHMSRALELARRGLWTTDPNPRVGCVIAEGERVISEGWHERAGGPHAEAAALAVAGAAARGATAYVTLEPCCHHGRTPPCTDALIAAGLRRVCYAIRDPNPRISGGGAARLAAAGIDVTNGVLGAAARALNPGFLSRMERGRPWLRVKLSGGGDLQSLRARSSAVMTGVATVLAGDPRLDLQLPAATRQPLRIVLDTRLRTPLTARIIAPPGQAVILTASPDPSRIAALESSGARVLLVAAGPGGLDLDAVMSRLAGIEINELQVESGQTLIAALTKARLVDELLD
ncbi:MAG: bifunctional diaminohydroxyphosphoribosylaminopyrimidine deaminase/5-amino-6-(5-phosphoribosylamino)uracil reductase RibD [Steroidobacteraceae bacterium]